MRKIYWIVLLCALSAELNAQTWVKTNGPYGGAIHDIVVHPSGTIYAIGDYPNQSLFRSADGANNWTRFSPAVMGNDAQRIVDLKVANDGTVYALASSNLYKTVDDGANWVKVNTVTGASSGGFGSGNEIAINLSTNTLYVTGYDGQSTVFRSTNGGATWTKGYQGQSFTQLTSNSIGDIYALVNGQTWKSSNDGTVFTQVGAPLSAEYAYYLTAKSDGSQLAIATSSSNMYTLTTPFPSATWTALTEVNIADPTTYGFSPKLLYSGDNTTLFLFDDYNNKVYSRTTGSWTTALTTTFITANGEDLTCAASRDANTLYVGSQYLGVFKSSNGGIGWTEVNIGIDNQSMENLVIADDGSIVAAGNLAFRSSDRGQSWSKISTTSTGYTVIKTSTANTLILLAQYGGTSYKSVNNGATWTTLAVATPNANKFITPDGTKILAYDFSKLYYSSNQGVTWSSALAITGLPATVNFGNFSEGQYVVMDQNANIFAYLYDSSAGIYKVYKIVPNSTTSPTTATATEISLATIGVTSVHDLKFLNGKVYIYGNGNSSDYICVTANAGTNWTPKTAPFGERLDVAPSNNYLFVTTGNSSNYTINISRDDATTFASSTVDLSANNTTPYGIVVDAEGVAFAGFTGSSAYKTNNTVVIPAAPANLVNSGSATDRIVLSFDDNATINHRFVVEKLNGAVYDSISGSGTMSSPGKVYIEVTNLEQNTSYDFKVYAKNSAGSSSAVNLTASTLEACASTLPDNKSWNGNVNGTKTLTNVMIRSTGNGIYSVSDINNGTTAASSTVLPGTFAIGCSGAASKTFLYPDYPVEPNGNGTWTAGTNTLVLKWITEPFVNPLVAATVTLIRNANDPTPQAPSNVTAHLLDNTSMEVSWEAMGFETKFTVERKTGAGGVYAAVGTVDYPATTFPDPGPFTAGTLYFYRVKSQNGNASPGVSPYSTEAQITFQKPNFVVAQTNVNTTAINSLGTLWADLNKDGFDDLVLTNFNLFAGGASPIFFQNDGAGNFSIAASNLEAGRYANGTAADYDNDGDIDLFYSSFGELNRLYNGNGSFTFAKVSPSAVESEVLGDFEGSAFNASWTDYDRDGLLDLFVARSGNSYSELFKQNADHTFTKIVSAGDLLSTPMTLFGIALADYDNDGDIDIFAIDQQSGQPDKLFRNNNDGTFTKVVGSAFDAESAMESQSCSWADFDNDQDFDLFIGTESGAHSLFRNNGNGTFTKLTAAGFVISTPGAALGSNWIDINNDGFIDLIVTGQEGNAIFMNTNGTSFTPNTTEKISDTHLLCIAASSSDYNNDGFMDIALSRSSLGDDEGVLGTPQKTLLFKNNNTTGNWAKVTLRGVTSNKSAIGAKIKIITGAKTQIRQVNAHIDIASQNSLTQHFGLGSATKIDNLTVTWPSGIIQTLTNVNANTTINITEDGAGPVITSRTPANSATAVSPATAVTITFDEISTAVSGKKLKIALASDPGTIIQSVDVTSATVSGNTYTYALLAPLQASSNYTVTIDAAAFKDVYGNAFLGLASGNWNFQTATPPAITALVPAHNSNSVSALTNLSVTFDKAINVSNGKLLKLYKSSDLVTPVMTINVATASIAANTATFVLPEKLQRSTPYNVSIDPAAFNDGNATDFPGVAASSWAFTTDPGPSYIISPAHNAIDVAINAPLQITFGKSVSRMALKTIRVMDGASVISQGDVSVVGSLASNVYTYPPPDGGWPNSKTLKIILDEGSFTDADGNDSAPILANTWNFTTAAPDITPPAIDASTLPSFIAKGFGTMSPIFSVTDNIAVSTVVVSIRKISGSTYTDVIASVGPTSTYSALLSETSHFDGIGAEYYITATDAAGNSARIPIAGTNKMNLTYSASQAVIPSTSIGFGGAKTGWKVFAIPFELTSANNNVSSIFEELAGKDNRKDYRLITLKNDAEWSEYPDDFASISRGTGYFINIRTDPGAIDLFDDLGAPQNSRSNLYQMSLKAGWNMIGNPYLTPISWADVAALNGLSGAEAQLKTFSGGTYSNDQTLGPYEGGFVLMTAAKTISIPFQGQTASGGRQGVHSLGEDMSTQSWAVPLTIRQDEISYTLGGIGMAPDANLSIDQYDDVTPPRFIDYLELNFKHPEHIAHNFTREIVPTQQNYTWEFTVDSNLEGMAQLVWNNAPLITSGKDLFLLDVSTQQLVDMKEMGTYSFDPKESSRFKIYYGDNLNIAPERVQLGKAYPNPTSGYTVIPFSLPETGGLNQSITLQIMDAMGRPVGTIKEGQYNPGYYEAPFDAKELASGFYTYRLSVKNRKGQTTQVNKLIVN